MLIRFIKGMKLIQTNSLLRGNNNTNKHEQISSFEGITINNIAMKNVKQILGIGLMTFAIATTYGCELATKKIKFRTPHCTSIYQ